MKVNQSPNKPYLFSGIMILLLFLGSITTMYAKGKTYNDEYSMEVQALKGPDDTEVIVTLSTSDPENFPIPDALKKLQVKIKDEDDDVVYIVNEKDAEVVNDQVIRFVDEPGPHETLYIKVLIQTSKNVVVLQAEAPVLLRPDLVIQNVTAPEEVDVDQAFNVDINIQEMNGELGATATVSLFVDGSLSAAYPGVQVDPADVSTVVFAGLSFSDPGTKNLSVVISDAVPGEYDVTNNEYSFTVEVLEPVTTQATYYWMNYENLDNYYYHYWDNFCGRDYESTTTGTFDYFYLWGNSSGDTPSGTIDEVTWSVGSENGVSQTGSISNWNTYYSTSSYIFYYYSDNTTGTWLYVWSYPTYRKTYFELSEYSGSYVYVYNYNGNTWSSGRNYGSHMNAQSSVTASILIEDDGLTIGGSASANVNGPYSYSYSWSGSGYSYWCGNFSYGYDYSYDYYYGESSGWMDPPTLPKSVVIPVAESEIALPDLPDRISLESNYPNPFNPSTTIEYALPEAATVSLKVYDLIGREIANLVEDYQSEGYHTVQFNATDLSSGTYLYVLKTGNFRKVKKMILFK